MIAGYDGKGVFVFAAHLGPITTEMAENMPEKMVHTVVGTPEIAAHTLAWLVCGLRE